MNLKNLTVADRTELDFQERDALTRDRDAWRERATNAEQQAARGPSA